MWKEVRIYSRADAFLDLVQQAMDAPPEVNVAGWDVALGPGQLCTSMRLLSIRWQWSTTKIRSFLTYLESERLIERVPADFNTPRADNPPTIITIRKFNRFRPAVLPEQAPEKPEEKTPPVNGKEKPKPDPTEKKWSRMSMTEKKTTRIKENTPLMIRIGKWFGQRPTTLWTIAEAEVLGRVNPPEEELDLMEDYYLALIPKDDDFRRREIITMLNNWSGERQKATAWKADNS